jgi:hypothetical protein
MRYIYVCGPLNINITHVAIFSSVINTFLIFQFVTKRMQLSHCVYSYKLVIMVAAVVTADTKWYTVCSYRGLLFLILSITYKSTRSEKWNTSIVAYRKLRYCCEILRINKVDRDKLENLQREISQSPKLSLQQDNASHFYPVPSAKSNCST